MLSCPAHCTPNQLQHQTFLHRDAIESLYNSKKFNEAINKMDPEDLRADLKSEVILIVMEKPAEMVLSLHNEKKLEFYAIRIMLTQIKSNTSPFYKKYRVHRQHSEIDERRT